MDDHPALPPWQLAHELHEVVCRYARVCDERDWGALDQVFSDEASAEYGGRPLKDRAAILRMLQYHLDGCGPTQHLLGNLQVHAGTAGGVTSRVQVRAAHRGLGARQRQTYDCLGEYQDRWVRTAAGWRIAHRRMIVTLEYGSPEVLGPK